MEEESIGYFADESILVVRTNIYFIKIKTFSCKN
jgi:hypothetical protein